MCRGVAFPSTEPTHEMARISHGVFENKRRLGPGAALCNGYDSLRSGIGKMLGAAPADAIDVQHGSQDGAQHGQRNGQQSGKQNGFQDGGPDGVQHGAHDGNQDGDQHGAPNGKSNGTQHGTQHGTPLEQALGVEFHVVNGVVVACEPGQEPPLEPVDHAEELLIWLQGQEQFVDYEVPSTLLEKMLYPYLAEQRGWELYAWRTVATEFAALDGVRKRQLDLRSGIDRTGPTPPIVYYIPLPDPEG